MTLDDYGITHDELFNVVINECIPTIVAAAAPTDVVYQVGTAAKTTSFVAFTHTPACGYDFAYQAEHDLGASTTGLPSAIVFDPASLILTVHTLLATHVNTYTVRIIATLDNTPQTFDDSVTFTIDI